MEKNEGWNEKNKNQKCPKIRNKKCQKRNMVKEEKRVRKMKMTKNITEKMPKLTNERKNQKEKFVENLVDYFAK